MWNTVPGVLREDAAWARRESVATSEEHRWSPRLLMCRRGTRGREQVRAGRELSRANQGQGHRSSLNSTNITILWLPVEHHKLPAWVKRWEVMPLEAVKEVREFQGRGCRLRKCQTYLEKAPYSTWCGHVVGKRQKKGSARSERAGGGTCWSFCGS